MSQFSRVARPSGYLEKYRMPRSKGFRRGTRSLLTSRKRSRGLSRFMREYKVDDKVVIQIDPSQHKGMPHRRFHGRVGTINKVNIRSLVVTMLMGSKLKTVIARLEHVKPHKV